MRTRLPALLALLGTSLCIGTTLLAQHPAELSATASSRLDRPRTTSAGTLLPNGWVVQPAGRQIPTGDLPLAMSLAPDGDYLLVTTGGYAPCQILAINTHNEQVQTTQTVDQLWEGIAFRPDGNELYVSGGGRSMIWRFGYEASGGDLIRKEPIKIEGLVGRAAPYARQPRGVEPSAWIAGVVANPDDGTLYMLNNQTGEILAVDPATGAMRAHALTGDHPNALALAPDHKRIYVTNQGGGTVSIFEAGSLAKVADVSVGSQPVALLFSHDGTRLFVANSGSNTVSILRTLDNALLENIRTSLTPNAPTGSTPNALALSPDGRTLFVTNADNNDVAVIDVSDPNGSRVRGFIPTGWYPTAVAVSQDGKKLFIGVGKGLAGKPSYPRTGGGVGLTIYQANPKQSYGPTHDRTVAFDYICSLVRGAVSVVDMPSDAQLATYTAQVIAGCPYRDSLLKEAAERPAHCAIPWRVGAKSPIQHVVYIIKENRTYDQMFGDIKEGDGDPNLVLFGENVTPNHHALARQFVLLDNLYCNGDVSEDGHQWCNAAFCTDWTEKVYPGNYATPSRGDAPGNEAVSASSGGYLWDNCAKHGLTYRTYGEFTSFRSDKDSAPEATSDSPALRGHVSLAWELARRKERRDYRRVDAFIEEMHEAERTGEWPNYMVMSLGEDHTTGNVPGTPTPWASVASNDVAVGKLVEAVSHSKFWPSTAIFIIEDDAQAGPDHVDARRTVGLVISPYIRRRTVDHTFYTTSSFLRTMELALGLPPMTQYDAGATPLFRAFTDRPDLTPYTALQARTDLTALNPTQKSRVAVSSKLDFSDYDRCDPDTLNRLLWHMVRGANRPYPVPMAGAHISLKVASAR